MRNTLFVFVFVFVLIGGEVGGVRNLDGGSGDGSDSIGDTGDDGDGGNGNGRDAGVGFVGGAGCAGKGGSIDGLKRWHLRWVLWEETDYGYFLVASSVATSAASAKQRCY